MLHVNFDPLIVRLLREVKYFLLLGLKVPESALEVFGRGEVSTCRYYTQVGSNGQSSDIFCYRLELRCILRFLRTKECASSNHETIAL